MLLTRMYLNPRRRQTIRFMRDPQALHAAIESAFPPVFLSEQGIRASGDAATDPPGSRLLWRLDVEGDERRLLILSAQTPSLEHVQEQAGWGSEKTWETRSYNPLLTRLARGQRYAFRITANPVHTVTSPNGKKRLLAHVSVRHQQRWLLERAERMGVRFLPETDAIPAMKPHGIDGDDRTDIAPLISVSGRETLHFRRGQQQVTLARAQFDGALEVADVSLLRTALVSGVGRGKAYGCGLLTLAPLRSLAHSSEG